MRKYYLSLIDQEIIYANDNENYETIYEYLFSILRELTLNNKELKSYLLNSRDMLNYLINECIFSKCILGKLLFLINIKLIKNKSKCYIIFFIN